MDKQKQRYESTQSDFQNLSSHGFTKKPLGELSSSSQLLSGTPAGPRNRAKPRSLLSPATQDTQAQPTARGSQSWSPKRPNPWVASPQGTSASAPASPQQVVGLKRGLIPSFSEHSRSHGKRRADRQRRARVEPLQLTLAEVTQRTPEHRHT